MADTSLDRNRVCLGVIVGAQGVRGAVRVKPFTEDPMAVGDYGPVETKDGARRFKIEATGVAKGVVICKLQGITDRDVAEAMRGTELYVDREALPDVDEDEEGYYHADLIGLEARGPDGTLYGRVLSVQNFGAGDLLEIARPEDGHTVLVPFTDDNVPLVDLEAQCLTLDPPAGLFDEGEADE
ncbi:MAG: ribosome maturation factor RimM [Parvibaculum sp.]|nr:ribosome maturation factor RimM [Parvibaculum sp.]